MKWQCKSFYVQLLSSITYIYTVDATDEINKIQSRELIEISTQSWKLVPVNNKTTSKTGKRSTTIIAVSYPTVDGENYVESDLKRKGTFIATVRSTADRIISFITLSYYYYYRAGPQIHVFVFLLTLKHFIFNLPYKILLNYDIDICMDMSQSVK